MKRPTLFLIGFVVFFISAGLMLFNMATAAPAWGMITYGAGIGIGILLATSWIEFE